MHLELMETQLDRVRKYYDSTVIDYKLLWTGPRDLAMHFGYYNNTIKSHADSLLQMNRVLSNMVSITKDDIVLDAGCGYGGSVLWLAKNIGCKVVGITVVPYQVKEANNHAKKYRIDNNVGFELQDYSHTSFSNSSFTVVWGLESIVHAESKKDFVEEAYRLLKSEGRILISEYMLREKPPLLDEEKKIINPWLKGCAMPSLLTPAEYLSLLNNTGFKNIQIYDLTYNVKPSLDRLKNLLILRAFPAKILHRLHIISTEHYGNVEAAIYQMRALEIGLWRYKVITAEKI